MVTTVSFRDGGLFIFVKEMINIAIKLATSITYIADGSQTNFSVPFDYLRPSFVHVAVDDAEVSEGFTISNRMVMFDSAPAKDSIVHIYRSTSTTRLVSWADASILKAKDMTVSEVQQLHILEEASDWSKTNSIVLDEESGAWQGRKFRVSNIADPKDAQDAVTKKYLDNEESSMMQRMNAIKTQTEQLMNTAGNYKDNAYNSAQSASTSAASAAESARLAEGYKNVAETAKSDASLYAANAKTSADNAGASKEAAQSAATTASNFAADARNSAGEAKTYRDAASIYAANAKNYSENVNVFIPSVSSDGVLSWTNKAGLANPPAVTLSGGGSNVTVDTALSDTSTNPVQNKVIKAALDNRAVLDDANTFTSPNRFDDIYMQNGINSLKWYDGSPNFVVGHINSKSYTGNAATATKATQDSAGNVITDTYATKTDISGVVKSVNGVQPDTSGNVSITVGGGSNAAVDTTLSATSTNAIANKTVYSALGGKLGKTETAYAATKATQDGAGNVITETYTKKADFDKTIGQLQVAFQEKVDRSDLSDVATSGQYSDLRGKPEYVVQSVNNVRPDENGNVSISVSGGGGVSTSESNTWTAQQNFHDLMLNREKYTTYVVNGASDTPVTSTMVYAVTGAFTLNLATLAGALSASQSSVFTAYFAANADYSLTISNAGKLKYTGSASDVAITTSGLLLNIWMSKDGGGTLTSIVQASKLS